MVSGRTLTLASLLMLAACEDGGPVFLDAGPDASTDAVDPTDAAPADANVGPATVTVRHEESESNPGTPVTDARVFFIAPDGSTQAVTTGADGRATAVIVPGTAIIATHEVPLSGRAFLTFVLGAEPGLDVLTGPASWVPVVEPLGTATVTWPAVTGATSYRVRASCTNYVPAVTTTSATLTVLGGCAGASTATVVAHAYGAAGWLGYSVAPSVDLTALVGASHELPPFASAMSTASVTYTAIPATVGYVSADLQLRTHGTRFAELSGSPEIIGTTAMISDTVVPVGATTTLTTTIEGPARTMPVVNLRRAAGQQLGHTVALGQDLLPFATFPVTDTATRTASWDDTGGRAADALIARGSWFHPSTERSTRFTVMAPSGARSFTLPPLPAELAAYELAPDATIRIDELWQVDLVGREGFAAVVGNLDPESRDLFGDRDAFPDIAELWFSGTVPVGE